MDEHGLGIRTRRRWHSFWLTWPAPQPVEAMHECRATLPGLLPWLALIALPALYVAPVLTTKGPVGAVVLFWVVAAETFLVLLIAGWAARRNWRGIFMALGQRNVSSLSVTTTILWTTVFLAAIVTAVLLGTDLSGMSPEAPLQAGLIGGTIAIGTGVTVRKLSKVADEKAKRGALRDLDLNAPTTTTKNAGEGLVLALAGKAPTAKRLQSLGVPPSAIQGAQALAEYRQNGCAAITEGIQSDRHGVLYGNACPCQARLLDILEGDEIGNAAGLDASKVQFAAVALACMMVYVGGFVTGLSTSAGLAADPGAMPTAMLEAFGVSSAAYLGIKVPTQTPVKQNLGPLDSPRLPLADMDPSGAITDIRERSAPSKGSGGRKAPISLTPER